MKRLLRYIFGERPAQSESSAASVKSELMRLLDTLANDSERERLIFSDETEEYVSLDDLLYDIDSCSNEAQLTPNALNHANTLVSALRAVLTAPELDISWSYQNGNTTYYLRSSGTIIPDTRRHFVDFLRQSSEWQIVIDSAKALQQLLIS